MQRSATTIERSQTQKGRRKEHERSTLDQKRRRHEVRQEECRKEKEGKDEPAETTATQATNGEEKEQIPENDEQRK